MKKKTDKQILGTILVIKENDIWENIPFHNSEESEKIFLHECQGYISNFDEYTRDDIDKILKNKREIFGRGFIAIHWF